MIVCFFKQKTAYELRISDWSSDVCSSDLADEQGGRGFRIEVRMQFAPCLSGVEQGMQPFAIMADQGLGHALGKRLARSLHLPEQHSRYTRVIRHEIDMRHENRFTPRSREGGFLDPN